MMGVCLCRDGGEVRKISCLRETQQDGVVLRDERPWDRSGVGEGS